MANINAYSTAVRNCVKNHVIATYNLSGYTAIEPFYDGDDYTDIDYNNKVVVDEPPYNSIMTILNYYVNNNVKFFLYIPSLCDIPRLTRKGAIVDTSVALIKRNVESNEISVVTLTSFITNLEPSSVKLKTYPDFRASLLSANSHEYALRLQKITLMKNELAQLQLYTSEDYVTAEHTVDRS